MLCNLNEKCLIGFLTSCGEDYEDHKKEMLDHLNNLGVRLKFYNTNPVNEILDEIELYE